MDLVEIASKHILLQQSRKALKGRCPFHNDETTSLMIIAQSNYFKCMGCGAEGGPVEFMMLIDGKSRNEVVSQLAKQEFSA
jgi:DNA primase